MAANSNRLQFFERDIRLVIANDLAPEAVAKKLAATARAGVAEYLATQQLPPAYVTIVNGRRGALEESVIAPGPIIYEFSYFRKIAEFGLSFLVARSPHLSGDYAKRHLVLHNSRRVEPDQIPADAEEFILTNDSDYARKVQVKGAMPKMRVPPGIMEDCRQAILARFGQVVEAQVQFILLPHARYRLKKDNPRPDRQKGMPLTYPGVVVSRILR